MHLVEDDLVRWGRTIGREVERPVFLGLRGPLGAGKSVLARAVAQGAGVESAIPSPTFNLLFRYPLPDGGSFVHLDLYRLADADEVWELGWEELAADDQIVVVEWPERAEGLLPKHRWDIRLDPVKDDVFSRRISVDRTGSPPDLPAFPMTVAGVGRPHGGSTRPDER